MLTAPFVIAQNRVVDQTTPESKTPSSVVGRSSFKASVGSSRRAGGHTGLRKPALVSLSTRDLKPCVIVCLVMSS